MTHILIVEDQPRNLHIAEQSALAAGISNVEARTSLRSARIYLENGLQGDLPLPDCIVLDLDLGQESGFELLRLWHSTPSLSKIPMIIWTLLGDENKEICEFFKVNAYISKWEDRTKLRDAIVNAGITDHR